MNPQRARQFKDGAIEGLATAGGLIGGALLVIFGLIMTGFVSGAGHWVAGIVILLAGRVLGIW